MPMSFCANADIEPDDVVFKGENFTPSRADYSEPMTRNATLALFALAHLNQLGEFATVRWLQRRNCPVYLLWMAKHLRDNPEW